MASSKVVTTNPDLPRQSSICSLSALLTDHHHHQNNNNHPSNSNCTTMDELLKSIYTSSSDPDPDPDPDPNPIQKDIMATNTKTVDEVWKDIVSGTDSHTHSGAAEEMTLEDFLTKAGAVTDQHVDATGLPSLLPGNGINGAPQFPMEGSFVEGAFGNGIEGTVVGVAAAAAPPPTPAAGGRGKRRVVEEPVDKATLQKQRRMIKNRESAARSRERKQAYTVELETLVTHLEEENARLLREEADQKRQRFKQLMECLIPVVEKRKPRRMLRRVNSVQW